ncbi:MAG: SMP-30/gluconolactonase/LRE family protein [Egibacteraceae bacterium]
MRTLDTELLLDAHAELGEGPVWDEREHRLLWVDITQSRVHSLDPVTGRDEHFDVGQHVGAVGLRASGGLVMAVRDGFAATDRQGHVRMLAEADPDPNIRMNDGKPDPGGRFWAGTIAYDQTPGAATLFRLDPDGAVRAMVTEVTNSNGLDWLDDRMYYIDTKTRRVDVFDYDVADGSIRNRRRVVDVDDGSPDGMTLDADGCLWVAVHHQGEIRRFTPDGQLDTVVRVPVDKVTSCCFGGEDLATLFITTASEGMDQDELREQRHAGGVFACQPGVTGRQPFRYAG